MKRKSAILSALAIVLSLIIPTPAPAATATIQYTYDEVGNLLSRTVTTEDSSPAGAVAFWKFDENSGNTAEDATGNANNGEIIGATWTSGVSGSALSFNGTDNYVDVGNVFTTAQTEFSVETWVYVNSFNQPEGQNKTTPIMSTWNNYWVREGYTLVAFHYQSASRTHWTFTVCDGTNYRTVTYDNLPDNDFSQKYAGQWLHLAGTYKAGEFMKIYINGEEKNSRTTDVPSQMIPFSTKPNWIARAAVNAGYLNGVVDEMVIYNKALTDTEVLERYNTGGGQ